MTAERYQNRLLMKLRPGHWYSGRWLAAWCKLFGLTRSQGESDIRTLVKDDWLEKRKSPTRLNMYGSPMNEYRLAQ